MVLFSVHVCDFMQMYFVRNDEINMFNQSDRAVLSNMPHRWVGAWQLVPSWTPQQYDDVIMGTMASQITSLTVVYSTFYSGAHQSKHQSSASLAFVWGIHRGPVNSPHKWPVTRKMLPFDYVILTCLEDEQGWDKPVFLWSGGLLIYWWPSPGMSEESQLFEFGVMCCMLITFHVSSRIVDNISEPSLLFSQ